MHRGLTHTYTESEEDLPSLRGRILVARMVRRVVHDRVDCRYGAVSADTPENLLLKASLHQLRHDRPREILPLLSKMGDVSLTDVTRGPWPRIRYSQLNRHYKRSLDLARLAIRGPPRRITLERRISHHAPDPYPNTGESGETYDVEMASRR